ncbi:MAG: hypothetical protein V3V08_14725 [Nannocystaceae bacterium]
MFGNDEDKNSLAVENHSFEGAIVTSFRCLVTGNDITRDLVVSHEAGSTAFTKTTQEFDDEFQGDGYKKPYEDCSYFLEAHLGLLDAPREWHFDPEAKAL